MYFKIVIFAFLLLSNLQVAKTLEVNSKGFSDTVNHFQELKKLGEEEVTRSMNSINKAYQDIEDIAKKDPNIDEEKIEEKIKEMEDEIEAEVKLNEREPEFNLTNIRECQHTANSQLSEFKTLSWRNVLQQCIEKKKNEFHQIIDNLKSNMNKTYTKVDKFSNNIKKCLLYIPPEVCYVDVDNKQKQQMDEILNTIKVQVYEVTDSISNFSKSVDDCALSTEFKPQKIYTEFKICAYKK